MKKKIIVLISYLALIFVLGGCNKIETDKAKPEVITEEINDNGSDTKVETDDNGTDVNSETAAEVPYNYVQELNIIDDNYRNFYEIFVYSFYDSDGDGIGDINGIISKLDYINDGDDSTDSDLGFNGIWLMPIMPSTTYHKYDVKDYYNIDPQYGTLEDFKKLIKECKARDIKLIIDLVFNHTSAQHPWFTQAVHYLESLKEGEEPDLTVCPYVGYYNFAKENN